MNRRSALAIIGSQAAVCAVAVLSSRAGRATAGARAPDFTLRSAAGAPWQGTFRLSDHLGKSAVVLSFFATWCEPCERELVLLERLRSDLAARGLVMVAVSIDDTQSASLVGPMARRLSLGFPVLLDADSSVTSRYDPRRLVPFLVQINRQGRIVHEREGFTVEHMKGLPAELEALVAR